MGRHYTEPVLFVLCFLCTSCAFDPGNPKLHGIAGNYYAIIDPTSPNNGLQIVYTKDNEFFKDIASNCQSIYADSNEIIFSKGFFTGDTTNIRYYTIDMAVKSVKKIDSASFKRKMLRLKKVQIK